MKAPTKGNWTVKKQELKSLPNLHVMSGDLYLCSVHQTNQNGGPGDEHVNARFFAASKEMYEAITIGLTGKDLEGKPVSQEDAVKRLVAAKAKAEGKNV